MDNMDLQPEDVRVPSGDSSPTQAPPDDSLSQQEHTADLVTPVDPALSTSIPRSENQYNEDYTDYARQVHNSTHGAWPVAEPFEEWACRRSHQERYWFYRAWFHHKTLPWDHEDIEYYKSATGYFIDDHPASHWPAAFSRVWGTRGWQLVLSATHSLSIWTQCEKYDAALRAEEERIAAEEERLAAAQQLSREPAPRRGQKRQAVDNLEHLNVQYQIEALLHNFSHLGVSKVPMLQGLPAPQQEQLISGVVHTLTTYRDELHQSYRPDDPPGHSTASSSAPVDYIPTTDPLSGGAGLPLPLPDSGSMSLNSTSTESQNTLEPPFPTDRPRD